MAPSIIIQCSSFDQQVSGGGGANHKGDHQNNADGFHARDDGEGNGSHEAEVNGIDG